MAINFDQQPANSDGLQSDVDTGQSVRPSAGRITYGAASLGTVVVIWLLLTSVTGVIAPETFPSPIKLAERFFDMLRAPYSGETLLGHVLMSLTRWALGLLTAVVVGVPVGIALAWIPVVRAAVTPVFELLRYIPPFAWIPIAVLAFGASTEAQAAVVFVAAFPVCVINTQTSVSLVDPIFERAALTLGSKQLRTLRSVVLPDALPLIFTGVRTAMSNGWMALVGAELVVGKEGLGFLIAQGQINNSPATIVVGMVSIGMIGFLIDVVMQKVQRLVTPWNPVLRAVGK